MSFKIIYKSLIFNIHYIKELRLYQIYTMFIIKSGTFLAISKKIIQVEKYGKFI